jgi:hypothetical protein
MRKYAVTLLTLLAIGSICFATQQEGAGSSTTKPALKTHSGEVVSVDSAKSEIVIKHANGKQMTCPLSPDVKITKARKKVAVTEVKPGDRVTCKCDESGGKCNVKSLSVSVAQGKKL